MVVLVRFAAAGRGFIYTSASFSGQADFALCANPDFVRHRTKSACPTAAEKCLPAAHLPKLQVPQSAPSRRQPEAKV